MGLTMRDLAGKMVVILLQLTSQVISNKPPGVARVGRAQSIFHLTAKRKKIKSWFVCAFDFSEELPQSWSIHKIGYIRARRDVWPCPGPIKGASGIDDFSEGLGLAGPPSKGVKVGLHGDHNWLICEAFYDVMPTFWEGLQPVNAGGKVGLYRQEGRPW